MTEPDFSKMSTREILMWEIKNAKTEVVKIDTVEIEKEVWESTLNRSMVLEAENAKLKFDIETYHSQYKALTKQNGKLLEDAQSLAQKLLQVKPELRGWLEKNYKEYL